MTIEASATSSAPAAALVPVTTTRPAELVRTLDRARADHERIHADGERVGEATRARHHLARHLAQHTVALLGDREDVTHRTFASSRSSRSNSGTAAGPSPTTLPSLRCSGGVKPSTSSPPAPSAARLSSSGFFLAAMMPFRAG